MAPFCSCPVSLVSRFFFAVVPGCAKCFLFYCATLGAATFRRGQSKKNTTQGVFFLLRPRRKAGEGEAPLGAGTGPEQKKWVGVLFFLLWPRAGPNGASPSPAFRRGRSKKKKLGGVIFARAPPKGSGAQRGATKKNTQNICRTSPPYQVVSW